MLDARITERTNGFRGFLGARNTGSNTETFDGQPLTLHLLPQGELEAELTRVDVERVERNAHSRRNQRLYFRNFGTNGSSIVVAPTSKFNVVASAEDGTDEASLYRGRRHARNHNGRLAK